MAPPSRLDQELLVGTATGALFLYSDIPGGIGADLNPVLLAALRAGLGTVVGLTIIEGIEEMKSSGLGGALKAGWPWNVWFNGWKGAASSPLVGYGYTTVFKTAMVAGAAAMIFPGNQSLQAALTAVVPYFILENLW